MPHNFWESLAYESSKANQADRFYSHTFGVEAITRFDTGSSFDMEFQRKDIDLQLEGWGRFANVSEKFRDKDFNDLYLELYSMFPERRGWMHNSEADYLAYFFPTRMFWINKRDLLDVFSKHIENIVSNQQIDSVISKRKNKSFKEIVTVELNGKTLRIPVIIAFNQTKTKNWNTVGISIPFKELKDLGLSWREYSI
ncbi:MAG: hypothetical protein ACPGEG_04150 [Salibacteraceae bacterium]